MLCYVTDHLSTLSFVPVFLFLILFCFLKVINVGANLVLSYGFRVKIVKKDAGQDNFRSCYIVCREKFKKSQANMHEDIVPRLNKRLDVHQGGFTLRSIPLSLGIVLVGS